MREYPKQFQKVVNYLKKSNIAVSIGKGTCYMSYMYKGRRHKEITIHHNYNLEKNGLYALLHEAGHSLQTNHKYGPDHYKNIDDTVKPKEFNMYQFINENDAWEKGLKLGKSLRLKLDPKSFNQQKEEALLTYYK